MKLLVQKFLRNRSLKDLQIEHGVYASISKNRKKISLNYSQIESKENDILALDCRGLILSKEDLSEFKIINDELNLDIIVGETKIIAFGLRRFFNYGQEAAAKINWNDKNLLVQSKEDGSIIILYFDDITNSWSVATRSVPNADIPLDNWKDYTFRTLFERAIKHVTNQSFEDFTKDLDKDFTYCFELCTPLTRIVVDYKEDKIFLLGIRNKITFEEICPFLRIDILPNVPRPQIYNLSNINDIIELVNSKNPLEHEGVVVRDSSFNRIKIKNINYVSLNKARDILGSSVRACLELILNEKEDDVMSFMAPEIQKTILSIKEKLQIFIKKYEYQYKNIINQMNGLISNFPELKNQKRKVFALLVNNSGIWNAPAFELYMDKVSDIKGYIKSKSSKGAWSNSFLDQLLVNIEY